MDNGGILCIAGIHWKALPRESGAHVHLVRTGAVENPLILAWVKTGEKRKGNEVSTITAIPTLWEMRALDHSKARAGGSIGRSER